ncbi:hypothetical protein P691DRAFT_719171 [Macrolepiota fuliginosa MF-IS2]|uniref:Uncharacterized protein n=1 Tax=Macrolepiota fuliginosa MF-IS2 TaxID=1400762 RepID=A0A9P6C6J7_9AGAR|nr:hypothetical protein P691DRAFT_719171 [Macrolepiota fuliginosa MF-IS2]
MPTAASTSTKSKKDKSKKTKFAAPPPSADTGKNEGANQNWAFQPPAGAKVISTNAEVDNGDFDWDAVQDDEDVEVWVLRVPDNVKPKHLEGLSLDLPSSSSKKGKQTTTRVGTLNRKHNSYGIWSLGGDDSTPADTSMVGGEELKSLSCLLPRKSKKGRLYPTPKPITRHIIVSAQPPQPTSPDSSTSTTMHQNPPRHKYPSELLTHQFMPYGSLVDSDKVSDLVMMEVDNNVTTQLDVDEKEGKKTKKKKNKTEVGADGEGVEKEKKKSKKRKGEDAEAADAPVKKSKKAKTSSG